MKVLSLAGAVIGSVAAQGYVAEFGLYGPQSRLQSLTCLSARHRDKAE
jgi:hypothetical protein